MKRNPMRKTFRELRAWLDIGIPASGTSVSGIGLVPASAILFIPAPDWLDAEQSGIKASDI